MPRFIPPRDYHFTHVKEGERPGHRLALDKKSFAAFNLDVLGLGDVSAAAEATDAIAAVFDLEGFTNFCKQIEPHLSVPKYLDAFLTWLMQELREGVRDTEHGADVVLWTHLPFFVKFLGDGLLVLWDCKDMPNIPQRNVIVECAQICFNYKATFTPTLKTKMVDPPTALRCGVARGTVFSVGAGQDYVGSCINMAARLQKLPGITFVLTVAVLTSTILVARSSFLNKL
jgi:class 3 adenylate cyclase